jgi:hypothetical protein
MERARFSSDAKIPAPASGCADFFSIAPPGKRVGVTCRDLLFWNNTGTAQPTGERVFKQICFFRRHPDMSMEQFIDYYENQHSQLSKKMGRSPSIPNAVRYVRRYLKPERNPITGEVHDPGYDCVMEIWWNSREDFERSQAIIRSPDRLEMIKADEKKFFATHANPVCSVVEYDSPMGPQGEATRVEVKHGDAR